MAQLSLGESKWRMLRRALKKKKRFQFEDTRSMSRHDKAHFEWLVKNGFISDLGDGWYGLTPKGVKAADLGLYETEELPGG